jgi:hypothetical protein
VNQLPIDVQQNRPVFHGLNHVTVPYFFEKCFVHCEENIKAGRLTVNG